MGELSLDNIMTGEEAAALFDPEYKEDSQEIPEDSNEIKEKEKKETAEVVDVDNLFTEKPESVGSVEENKGSEDSSSSGESSPNFYSSIAKAFAEDGVFQNLNEEDFSKITDAETFRELIEEKIQSELDDRQKRIDEALNAGIEVSEVQKYENSLNVLNNITDETLSDESEKGETLRKNLIFQDYIQRGFSKERANKAVERSLADGTDIEDAREALQSYKEQINKAYKGAVEAAKAAKEQEVKELKEQADALKKSILSDKKPFGELELDKTTRQRVFDAIAKPVYKDPTTGESLTAIQKFEADNHIDFMKYVGLTYVLTDGFKSLDGLVKGKVKKEVNKSLKELEHTLNNTARNSGGALKFASGVNSDPESVFRGFTLDI